jgi:MarR family transcriptional regulator, organic hydroperoxide resistance regulator
MASTIEVLEGSPEASYRDLVVSVHESPEETLSGSDLANDTWRRMTDLFHSRKEQVMAIAAAHRLNPGAMNALLFLEPGQPCSMRALADAWKCDASNVTWLVDRLEEHALAERRPHPSDRRVRTVALTRKGMRVRAQIESKLHEAPATFHDLTPAELATLNKILRKLSSDTRV